MKMSKENVLAVVLLLSIVLGVGLAIYNVEFIYPVASDNAHNTCVERGYETFISYSFLAFSSRPMALYCGTAEQRMIYEGKIIAYKTNGNNSIIISDRVSE